MQSARGIREEQERKLLLRDDYLTMNDSSNRSNLGAKSSLFQAKIRSHTRLYFTVALIKNTECINLRSPELLGLFTFNNFMSNGRFHTGML